MKKPKGDYAIQTVVNAMRLLEASSQRLDQPLLFHSHTCAKHTHHR